MRKITNSELGRLTPEEFKQADKVPVVVVLDNGQGGLSKEHAPDGVHPVADAYTLMEAEVMKTLSKVVKLK